ncbi:MULTISPECIES: AAA family ATPase [Desulfitobacterium]|uniref:Putative ATPase n=1 Tax=Desulfitobacterium dehalogenans (strain ATCC 51507 / DSM 9161 / JW/IU-DC1) TaxID=756499 RepID=I4A6N2_DESDJ|nr:MULTISPECIES: AAA family ATPase [Desulfitobacterium]AFL99616.1 putative ATPase [Desulfitobacterium dehalogenans ATCC 51507]
MAYLKKVTLNWERADNRNIYPFNIPALVNCASLDINHNVVFFVGENGTGKSTLLEAIAYQCGFGIGGGDRNVDIGLSDESVRLASILTLSWMPKINQGFFLRAETFFDFAKHLDERSKDPYAGGRKVYDAYGGKSLNQQSHGEAFLSLFANRFGGRSLYILDEPEAALSPQRQLAFLGIINDLEMADRAQFIIATHSPILMAYPGAQIYECNEDGIIPIDYEETDHYRLTKAFLDNPDRFFKQLFS